MRQKLIRALVAATQSKATRGTLTVFPILVAVLAMTGCKHPH